MAQYPYGSNYTCYGDKEKSIHFNNTVEVGKKMSKEAAARQFDVMVIRKWFAPKYK